MRGPGPKTIETTLQTLFEQAPFGLAVWDVEGRYLRVNTRMAELNAVPADEHPGLLIEDVAPAAGPLAMSVVTATARSGRPQSLTADAEAPGEDGVARWTLACYPVFEEDVVTAVVGVVFTSGTSPDELDQLIEIERALRGRAESAGHRAEFLAEATTALDSSLDLPTTLRTLARIVVPELADLCLVDMVNARTNEVRRFAVAHRDPEQESFVWDMTRRWPSAPEIRRGIRRVLADGATEYIPQITDAVLEAAFPNPEHRERVRELGLSASIIVPIRARGRTLGAVTFARTDAGTAFTPAEVALAEELVRRAALAVDNARLHTDLRRADRAQRLISEASRILSESLNWGTTVDHLARLLTADLADACVIDAIDASGALRAIAASHREPARQERLHAELGSRPTDRLITQALTTGQSSLLPEVREEDRGGLDAGSRIVVPMLARGRAVGAISLIVDDSDRRFDEDDLRVAEEIGRRAGVAADNARLYEERTRVARTLQRSLMPLELPRIPRIDVAVRFRAAGDGSEVGGDFYDVFEIGDDTWCAVVGDVCGKGAEAAGVTALSRHTVRAAARYEDGPVGVLRSLNEAIDRQAPASIFATAALACVEPGDGAAEVRVARGGHLPPLVLRADGRVEALLTPGVLLGIFDEVGLEEGRVTLAPGDALVLYTDGVTEAGAPDHPLGETGLHAGLTACAGLPADAIARRLEDLARNASSGLPRDDLAVLVMRYTG